MRRRAEGEVIEIVSERPGAQEALVRVETTAGGVEQRHAINLVELTGPIAVGDRVLLNVIAVEMGLGTGGSDFVVSVSGQEQPEQQAPGHIVKLRYTPLQVPVLAVEAPESPYHDVLRHAAALDDIPVVCAELHSQIPAICAAAHCVPTLDRLDWRPRIAYIMTDAASLPISLSRLVPDLKRHGLIDATITAGHAFGGDYEAVNLYSALAAACEVVKADIIVVGQGPGTVGTGTLLGFSGVDQGLAINAAASLGGLPIAVARISFADSRRRHSGLSHHTLTVLLQIARARALLPLPLLPDEQRDQIREQLLETGVADIHEPIIVDSERALRALEERAMEVTTMGRAVDEDRPFFLAAAAAGLLAAQLADARALRD